MRALQACYSVLQPTPMHAAQQGTAPAALRVQCTAATALQAHQPTASACPTHVQELLLLARQPTAAEHSTALPSTAQEHACRTRQPPLVCTHATTGVSKDPTPSYAGTTRCQHNC